MIILNAPDDICTLNINNLTLNRIIMGDAQLLIQGALHTTLHHPFDGYKMRNKKSL
ncbi:MAG: hypothetical protein M3R36_06705 [Bacteroidota bacterium]|nr:hypothetical protein [Bacteroidota bacterium]